jgi:hypothetical protein
MNALMKIATIGEGYANLLRKVPTGNQDKRYRRLLTGFVGLSGALQGANKGFQLTGDPGAALAGAGVGALAGGGSGHLFGRWVDKKDPRAKKDQEEGQTKKAKLEGWGKKHHEKDFEGRAGDRLDHSLRWGKKGLKGGAVLGTGLGALGALTGVTGHPTDVLLHAAGGGAGGAVGGGLLGLKAAPIGQIAKYHKDYKGRKAKRESGKKVPKHLPSYYGV